MIERRLVLSLLRQTKHSSNQKSGPFLRSTQQVRRVIHQCESLTSSSTPTMLQSRSLTTLTSRTLANPTVQLESNVRLFSDAPEITEEEYRFVVMKPTEDNLKNLPERFHCSGVAPLVLLFGWAGSSDKNLGKYSGLYRSAGCTTVQYSLPTRHIFRDTDQVPALMSHLYSSLVSQNLSTRPTFIHCLSDTGVLCYQGLAQALDRRGVQLDIRGVVWDSCPGPYPEVTLPRVMAVLIVNWMCCRRDGMTAVKGMYNSCNLLKERVWPNYVRRLKGLPVELNFTGGEWYGHFGRDHPPPIPELFLYSKTDFYLPWQYLEEEVLSLREGRDSKAVRWDKSPHVSHYKTHRQEYTQLILDFLYEKFFCEEREKEEGEEDNKLEMIVDAN